MKIKSPRNLILSHLIACSLITAPLATAQQKEEPKFKLVQFQMALMKKGPNWSAEKDKEVARLHAPYVISLLESGKMKIAGHFTDDTDIRGVCIFQAPSAEEAKTWAEGDPAVKAGFLVAEMHPWWSEDVFKKANSPLKFNTVYLAFLKRGPNRKEGDGNTLEIQELQKAHIANIERLAKLGKIVAAGPFGDDGSLRGIFVFRVSSLEEAQSLCATDPMVKVGRLAVELHPWQVPEGVIP